MITGKTAPPGHKPYQQAAPESVLANAMQRDAEDLSAIEQIREAQDGPGEPAVLLHLWSAATRRAPVPAYDAGIKARLTDSEGWRYDREHSRQVLQRQAADAQLAGHDVGAIIERITAAPNGPTSRFDLQRPALSPPAPAAAGRGTRRDVGAADTRSTPRPWLTSWPPGSTTGAGNSASRRSRTRTMADPASRGTRQGRTPLLSCGKTTRSGLAPQRRPGGVGITDPEQAISLDAHPDPEFEALRRDTGPGPGDRQRTGRAPAMSRGELEGQVLRGERVRATAPRDVSSQLRLTWQADADAWQQAATPKHSTIRRRQITPGRWPPRWPRRQAAVEAANARYEEWSARTASTREMAGKAKAELQRRGQEPATGGAPGPQSMATWWREFQADADAMDRAIEREHQAAVHDGQPWPPQRQPEAGHEEPDAAVPGSEPQLAYTLPGVPEGPDGLRAGGIRAGNLGPVAAGPGPLMTGRAARLDELQARVDEAARRIDAQQAELDASSEHTARMEREAHAEPEADRQAEAPYDMEMEL